MHVATYNRGICHNCMKSDVAQRVEKMGFTIVRFKAFEGFELKLTHAPLLLTVKFLSEASPVQVAK